MPAGRQTKEVEFLRTLRQLMGLNQQRFAKRCGKTASNMSTYLTGQVKPGTKVLRSCIQHLFEWAVLPLMEIELIPGNLNALPTTSGLYVLYDSAGNVLYIGKATNFRAEAPGWVEVLVAEGDLARAQSVLDEIHRENDHIDWSQVDVGEPEDG